jgi:hypothetical protein
MPNNGKTEVASAQKRIATFLALLTQAREKRGATAKPGTSFLDNGSHNKFCIAASI